ncbi:MAG: DNA polymerase III subunit alpha [Clostridia bacterium]|nr:DNA polymerase III subunit alpha [Clostridia bacterium]
MADFVHLHLHTEYSLLDGLATIPLAVRKAAKLGMPAIAMTDHGNMYGAVAFYDACCAYNKEAKEKGLPKIKAIFGTEFYVCDDITVKSKNATDNGERDRRHLILLVKNEQGYKNISKLNAIAFRDGFYYKPRIDLKTLKEHSEGLVCLSACVAGDIPQAILRGDFFKAEELIMWFKDVFGDDFYLEMQNHGLKEEMEVNQYLRKYSKEFGVKLVVTNDVHYVDKEDALPHDVLLCVQTRTNYNDPDRMRFNSDDYYLKSEEEMLALFPEDAEAVHNTLEIAEKCNFEFVYGHYMFPRYIPETGEEPVVFIRKLIDKGVKEKFGAETPEIRERIESELAVIEKQKFVEYFLIVWDYIYAAKKMGISVGPGRGSGAGSLIAYLLGITDIDPLKYDLYFERFLNAERVSAPDFDIDFEDCRREEVIDYVKKKYGEERVCRIITFGTMAAKNAIKDVGRALGVPYSVCDRITKLIPSKVGGVEIKRPNVIRKVFGFYKPSAKEEKDGLKTSSFTVPELVEIYNSDNDIKRVVDIAMRLEDTPRQSSTHACGVIIGHDVLDEHMPLSKNESGGEEEITSQYTGVELEHLGFLKMDFLGLCNLSDIKDCIEYVKENHGVTVDFSDRKYDDHKVYELISEGNTDAVFQLESAGFKRFLKDLKPTCLEDIIAAVSLYRPGPMDSIPTFVRNKHNPDEVTFLHPLLKPILEQTYGCIVYQEQVMRIVQVLAGYTLGQADGVRRMMGKKKVEEMAKEEKVFLYGKPETTDEHGKISAAIDGCIKRGVPEDVAKTIWSQMKDFAKYAFNKSHAAAYSVVTYETAYLKAYYEPEFLTSFLNNRIGNIDDIKKYTTYAKSEGIEVLPPDINESDVYFTVKNGKIRYGLAAIKNIGAGIIGEIIKEREKNGRFYSFEDFINRCATFGFNKRMIENLISAGAFDGLGAYRSQMIAVYGDFLDRVIESKRNGNSSQISLFDTLLKEEKVLKIEYPKISEFSSKDKLMREKEVCGLYLSGHPLADYEKMFAKFSFSTLKIQSYEDDGESIGDDENEEERKFSDVSDGDKVVMGGIVTEVQKLSTRGGSSMAFVKVEDLYGSIEVVVFPKIYDKIRDVLNDGEVLKISGRIQIKDNAVQIIADGAERLAVDEGKDGAERDTEYMGIILSDGKSVLDSVLDVLKSYPGDVPVIIAMDGKRYDSKCCVRKAEGLLAELRTFVREKDIVFFRKK